MKTALTTALILPLLHVLSFTVTGQNLVPNSGFEEFHSCPKTISDLDTCAHWFTPSEGTTDYYHTCSSDFSSNPFFNLAGTQVPQEGNAYIGIVTYQKRGQGYNELAKIKLKEPLKRGQYYKVSYYASLAEASSYSHALLGAKFTADSLSEQMVVNYAREKFALAEMIDPAIVSDANTWTLIKGSFKARGGEQYLILGCPSGPAYEYALEKIKSVKHVIRDKMSYYYIDNVEVIEASGKNDRDFSHREPGNTPDPIRINEFRFSYTHRLYNENESDIMPREDAIIRAGKDESFIPDYHKIDYLRDHLYRNPSMNVELVFHTVEDTTSRAYQLAMKRAEKLQEIIAKKIDKERIALSFTTDLGTPSGRIDLKINTVN